MLRFAVLPATYDRMIADGARLSSTEMVLFELTVNSGTDEFREMSRLVK